MSHIQQYATEQVKSMPKPRESDEKRKKNEQQDPRPPLFKLELDAFRDHLMGEKKSRYTIKQYVIMVRLFLTWANKKPDNISSGDLEMYRRYLSVSKSYSKNSLFLTTIALHSFFRFLKSNVSEEMKPPRRGKPIPKYLSEEEMKSLIVAAQEKVEDMAIILTLGYSGLPRWGALRPRCGGYRLF